MVTVLSFLITGMLQELLQGGSGGGTWHYSLSEGLGRVSGT